MVVSDEYIFKFGEEQELHLKNPPGVFTPTGTTSALVKAAAEYTTKPGKLLDLGCGNGVAGIALCKLGVVSEPLYASDLSKDAVEIVKVNAESYNCSVVARYGSVFEPWKNEKFDYILNDISGVAQSVAKISPWFNSVPCESGVDGADLIVEMLKSAPKHLNTKGILFFPVISLSCADRILDEANKHFLHVECLSSDEWPLPKEMYSNMELLNDLSEKKIISFVQKFGMLTYTTDIYAAFN